MSDNNFTPPEVVSLSVASINAVNGKYYTDQPLDGSRILLHSYTLTSSVEKAKRDAVRKVLTSIQDCMRADYKKREPGAIIAHTVWDIIDQLLSQYQEPTTEKSDDRHTGRNSNEKNEQQYYKGERYEDTKEMEADIR